MTEYYIQSKKFYTEFRNGAAFNLNLTDYTNELSGAVGELVQVVMEFEVETILIGSDFGSVSFTGGSEATFTLNGNWFNEGFSIGATVDIYKGRVKIATETVTSTNGIKGGILITTIVSTGLQDLENGEQIDIEFKVSSVSDRLKYKYGLNEQNASVNNYISPFDDNEQAYVGTLTGTLELLDRVGNIESWDLGNIQARYVGTVGTYTHQYEIEHVFRIPYFVEDEIANIKGNIPLPPRKLIGTDSVKYGFGIFLSETNNQYNKVFEDVGQIGNIKYYDLAVDGAPNIYTYLNLAYSNTLGTSTLEVTNTTTVTLQLKNNGGNFEASQQVIINHSKLPTQSEYENKGSTFDEVWKFDGLSQTAGTAAVSSTIIKNYTVTANVDLSLLDLSFDIEFTAAQQLDIENGADFILSAIVGKATLNVYEEDRANIIIDSGSYSRDSDVSGLVQGNDMRFFVSGNEIVTPTTEPTMLNNWDLDFVGVYFDFQTKAEDGALLKLAEFKLLARNTTTDEFFDIHSIPISLGSLFHLPTTNPTITTYPYQLLNRDMQAAYNITDSESFNRIIIDTRPPVYGTSFQDWHIELGFKIQWREWIENANVPNVFYDSAETNNNQNIKTSNYSGLNGYEIYAAFDLTIASDIGNDTIYRCMSGVSTVKDFDVNGGNGFTGDVKFYDVNGDETDNIYSNEDVEIVIEFTHASGLLPNAYGEIVIEEQGTTLQEWRLSTHKDWVSLDNILHPSITTNYVETIDATNLYTLKCKTKNIKIDKNKTYNIYGILGKR